MLDWIGLNISGHFNPDISIQACSIQVWINPIQLNPKFGGPPQIWVLDRGSPPPRVMRLAETIRHSVTVIVAF